MSDVIQVSNRRSKKIKYAERAISKSVLERLLEPYMYECLQEWRDMLMLFLLPVPLRTAQHSDRVDKKGWAFNDIATLRKASMFVHAVADLETDRSNGLQVQSRRESGGQTLLAILKYLTSSRLDVIVLFEVTLLETSIETITSRYGMSRDYVTTHLKGCLAASAIQTGRCNVPAALPYIHAAQALRLRTTPRIRRIRKACIGFLLHT